MPTLATRLVHGLASLAPKLPVRIDLPWAGGRAQPAADAPAEPTPSRRALHESAERSRLINQIFEFNPTAPPDFLADFSVTELTDYLDHLTTAAMPRGRTAIRCRPPKTPAISMAIAAL